MKLSRKFLVKIHCHSGDKIIPLYKNRSKTARFTRELLGHIKNNNLQIQVTEFLFEKVKDVHEAIEGRKTTRKVVLTFE